MVNPVIPATDFFLAILQALPQPIVSLCLLSFALFIFSCLVRLILR